MKKKRAQKKKRLIGFWHYDKFPFVLSGVLGAPAEDDTYLGRGYWEWEGTGRCVKPFLVMPEKSGLKLRAKLQELEEAYDKAHDAVTRTFKAELAKLIIIPKR